MKIDWSNLYKIRLASYKDSMLKHEVIKLLIVKNILNKYDKKWTRIYTEFPITEGKICDVYYENLKTKEAYAYEIQKNISQDWLIKTKKIYEDWEVPFMETTDWVLVKLNQLSDNIFELNKQIKKVIM